MSSLFEWQGKPSQIVKQPKRNTKKPVSAAQQFTMSPQQREKAILANRYNGVFLMAHPSKPPKGIEHEPDAD